MKDRILIAVAGNTDPIKDEFDGPILHIVRHYHPQKVIILLSNDIAKTENVHHQNEKAIKLVNKECQVECISTGMIDVHSYDKVAQPLFGICNQVKEQNPEAEILLNITSGTPQMKTALCMFALADTIRYKVVQVDHPPVDQSLEAKNKKKLFEPDKNYVDDWFETDIDNDPATPSRCHEPQLLIYKRPMVQFQIESLIQNYDYIGAFQLYEHNQEIFHEDKKIVLLLQHARKRLNLEYKEAEELAKKLNMKEELYPIQQSGILRLVEYFNSMQVKQRRGELNDFAMRLEVLTLYLGRYVLENCMRVKVDEICDKQRTKNSEVLFLVQGKCEKEMPGVTDYLNKLFAETRKGSFDWKKPLNALSIIHLIKFMAEKEAYKKYKNIAGEMEKWTILSGQVRNPAAHTIIAITEDTIRESYDNKKSSDLCSSIRTCMRQVFGSQGKQEAFCIYEIINEKIKKLLQMDSCLK